MSSKCQKPRRVCVLVCVVSSLCTHFGGGQDEDVGVAVAVSAVGVAAVGRGAVVVVVVVKILPTASQSLVAVVGGWWLRTRTLRWSAM